MNNDDDIFRKEVKLFDNDVILSIRTVKDKAEELYNLIDSKYVESDPRMVALSKTNLEQAIMWYIKSIT